MTKLTQYSFSAGEVAPDLYARTDVNKYGIALAKLKNGFVRVTGGISNRAGLEFVCEAKDSSKVSRLFPFKFNQSQQYIIEAGEGYFRYVQDGGQVVNGASIVETATSFTLSELFALRYAQTADVLTFCSPARLPQELSRKSNILWEISDIAIAPTIDAPASPTAVHSGTLYTVTDALTYKITAIKADTYEESLPSVATASVTASVLAGWSANEYVTLTWSAVAGATEYNIYKSVNGVYAYAGRTEKTTFKDIGINADLSSCIPIFKDPFDPSIIPIMTSNNLPSGNTASITSEVTGHEAYLASDGNSATYTQSSVLPATFLYTLNEGKIATKFKIKTKDNAPSSFKIIGRKAGDDTVDYSTPQMKSASQDGDTVTYNYQIFDSGSVIDPGKIPFPKGTLLLDETVTIEKFYIGAKNFANDYYATSATITFFDGDLQTGTKTINPSTQAGTMVTLSSPVQCNKIVNSVGTGSPWSGGGGGNLQTGKQYFGYSGGVTEKTLYTSSAALAANSEVIFEMENDTEYTTYGMVINSNVSGTAAQLVELDFMENGNNPATLNYFQQRSIYASTLNEPTSVFASQSTRFRNFNIQRPLLATSGITVRLDEREVNEIKHIVAMNDLVIFTADSEWRVNGSDGIFQATPPPVAKRQSSYGCSDLMPITAGSMILFVQAGQAIVRDLGYTFVSDSYDGKELSYLANHLFENNKIVDWAYSKEPNRIIWCVMEDGTLNALTYNKEQDILGWHHHETDGLFESVTVVREGFEDVPYFIINRTINGVTKRYIERMKSRNVSDAVDGFFVDCGLTRTFETALTEITGLGHLEGKEVSVLANGVVVEGLTVSGGKITLPVASRHVTIGLPYEFELKTLNIEAENTQGSYKIINAFSVKVDKTSKGFSIVGNDGTKQDLYSDNNDLYSGDIPCIPSADPTTGAYVHIKQSKPLPITVLSVTPSVEMG